MNSSPFFGKPKTRALSCSPTQNSSSMALLLNFKITINSRPWECCAVKKGLQYILQHLDRLGSYAINIVYNS